jgi:hypothetical protein
VGDALCIKVQGFDPQPAFGQGGLGGDLLDHWNFWGFWLY